MWYSLYIVGNIPQQFSLVYSCLMFLMVLMNRFFHVFRRAVTWVRPLPFTSRTSSAIKIFWPDAADWPTCQQAIFLISQVSDIPPYLQLPMQFVIVSKLGVYQDPLPSEMGEGLIRVILKRYRCFLTHWNLKTIIF